MTWEVRRALRYGSESVAWVEDLVSAKRHANDDISANGSEGRIDFIDHGKSILYYDVHAEMS